MNYELLIRPELLDIKPYSSARDEFEGAAEVFLDANENPFENGINRYPDPLQRKLKNRIAAIKGVSADHILLGNGSDECIDLLIRLFCIPGKDKVLSLSPSYGMYAVSAKINNIGFKTHLLDENFDFQVEELLEAARNTKIIWLCSPNNPNGAILKKAKVQEILDKFQGIVVLDEAYIDFSKEESWINKLEQFQNLVVLQTFSKAYGMAGLRLGMLFANPKLIAWLNKIKPPYNISSLTQEHAFAQLEDLSVYQKKLLALDEQKSLLKSRLIEIPFVEKVFPSDANFLLVRVKNADNLYQYLIENGVVVRNRSTQPRCENCLRITIGTPDENERVVELFNLKISQFENELI
jgi:histidinol-phosphate aminotransferase